MSKDPPRIKRLKELSRAEPTKEDAEKLEAELYSSSNDRATIVLFGSFVESSLRKLIETKLRNGLNSNDLNRLLGYEGVIGTFSDKIMIAFAFEIIGPKTRADLDDIRNLRNAMAHSKLPISFQTDEIADVCRHLRICHEPNSHIPHYYLDKAPREDLESALDKHHPKTAFITTCHNIAMRMLIARTYPQPGDVVYLNDQPLP